MGLLSKLLPIAGAAAGALVGMPQVGAALGSAAGGALSKSGASKKATKAQLQAIEDAKLAIGKGYEDVKGYQAPGLSTYQPGVNALTSRLGLPTAAPAAAPANALLSGATNPTAGAAALPGRDAVGPRARDAARTDGGMIDMTRGADGSYAMPASTNALTSPGTYGDTGNPTAAPARYEETAAPGAYTPPGAFSFTGNDLRSLPGYQFQQDEARRGVLASASATGALQSGAALKELSDRSQNIADTTFGREREFAYRVRGDDRDFGYGVSRDNRRDYEDTRDFGYGRSRDDMSDYRDRRNYLTDRFDTGTNDLFRYTGIGQGSANTLSAAATGYGGQMADLALGGGDVRATNYLTKGQIGSDLAGDIGGTLAGIDWKKFGSGSAPRIFG